ncbi:MAG TPA: hypothetical protein VJV76_06965 [Gaiellaceae bacterium]|nr:hypothetical protein [Gaiellaceae bacterium]
MRRLVLLVVAAFMLAACGSSHPQSSPTTSGKPSAESQIKSAYQKFFSGQASVSQRAAVLQNGAEFKPVIRAFASNPLAKNVHATVSSVTLRGPNNAKVVYTVKLGGAGLPQQTGTAVRQNGVWKVGDATLCKLVSLQGSTPSVCKS